MLEEPKFLFYHKKSIHSAGNTLKDLILFLKKEPNYIPHNFTFSPQTPNLINSLTLKENILLESLPISLCTNREFQLDEYLLKTKNEHLVRLFKNIDLINLYPTKAELHNQKITSLIRSFIKESPVIFFESPDEYLDDLNREIFKRALLFHKQQNPDQLIIIADDSISRWLDHTPHILNQSDRGQFEITRNPKYMAKEKFLSIDSDKQAA